MIPEAPFLFSIAGLSASLAGLAGLVAALRRGAEMRAIDGFRLRQIVEFAFGNALLAVGLLPLSVEIGLETAVRVVAGIGLVYVAFSAAVLLVRMRRQAIRFTPAWLGAATVLNVGAAVLAVVVLATGSMTWLQFMLLALLGRPMLAFLLVLASFEET